MHEISVKEITCRGEKLVLTNQRAVYWQSMNSLIIADMHLGKTAHFRKHGIAIPSSVMQNDLDRLEALIRYFEPAELIVIGDMFHAGYNNDLDVFGEWRKQFIHLLIILVKGNHDRLTDKQYLELGINTVTPLLNSPPFVFEHHPKGEYDEMFLMNGHVHPGKVIYGSGRQFIKLPCFIVTKNEILLPAFSHFTGLDTSFEAPKGSAYFLLTDKAIFEVGG